MAHPNMELMRKAYDAFNSGDMETLGSLFADDIQAHIPGRSQLSGDYKGKDDVFGMFGKLMEVTGGDYSVEVHDILANDEHAVVLSMSKGTRPDGRTHEANTVEVYHLTDGKISEFWALEEDQYRADEFYG